MLYPGLCQIGNGKVMVDVFQVAIGCASVSRHVYVVLKDGALAKIDPGATTPTATITVTITLVLS